MNAQNAIKKVAGKLQPHCEPDELLAMVTHWLQTPHLPAPLMSDKLRRIAISAICEETTSNVSDSADFLEDPASYQTMLSLQWSGVPYPPPKSWSFTFIDLFAGIGGFRQAFQSVGGKCVFSSEWDKYAKQTYQANYGETPYGDIRKLPKESIPYHDVLCAGFPCQPFSLAGVSKKNSLGRKHGFEDETQGTLFFEIKEILRLKRPKAFMLENVKNLLSHDGGRTFASPPSTPGMLLAGGCVGTG